MTHRESIEKWAGEKIENFTSRALIFHHDFNVWDKTINLQIMIKIRIGQDISERQENELKDFWNNVDSYYAKSVEEIKKYVSLDKENGNPSVPKKICDEVQKIAVPTGINVTRDKEDSPAALCLLFDYKYDESGICVMFRDGGVIETGSQDLLVC